MPEASAFTFQGRRYGYQAGVLLLFDLLALLASIGLASLVWTVLPLPPPAPGMLAAAVGAPVLAYLVFGLYTRFPIMPLLEFQRVSFATSLAYGVLGIGIVFLQPVQMPMLGYLGSAWCVALLLVPLSRSTARHIFASKPWWGCAAVVLGAGNTAAAVVRTLLEHREIGLRPVAVLADDPLPPVDVEGVPVVGSLATAPMLAGRARIPYGIVAMPALPHEQLIDLMERHTRPFKRLLIISDLTGFASLWMAVKDLNGILGFEIRHRPLNRWRQRAKRFVDVALAGLGLLLVLPLGLVIALMIRLESAGPVFFIQDRIGKRGRIFRIIKFRSMYQDGDRRLKELFARDPVARREMEVYHKLRDDVRVTRVGRVLRKYSLDELPQLLNVVRGEMSLVGPRPYLPAELPKMQGKERVIHRVMPGITGLWQVGGRNRLSFEARLELDVHYIRNWSVILDLYLLARTIPAALLGRGAH